MGLLDKVGSFFKREAKDLGEAAAAAKDKVDAQLTKRERELAMTPSEKIAALQRRATETDARIDDLIDKVGTDDERDPVEQSDRASGLPNVTHIVLPDGRIKSGNDLRASSADVAAEPAPAETVPEVDDRPPPPAPGTVQLQDLPLPATPSLSAAMRRDEPTEPVETRPAPPPASLIELVQGSAYHPDDEPAYAEVTAPSVHVAPNVDDFTGESSPHADVTGTEVDPQDVDDFTGESSPHADVTGTEVDPQDVDDFTGESSPHADVTGTEVDPQDVDDFTGESSPHADVTGTEVDPQDAEGETETAAVDVAGRPEVPAERPEVRDQTASVHVAPNVADFAPGPSRSPEVMGAEVDPQDADGEDPPDDTAEGDALAALIDRASAAERLDVDELVASVHVGPKVDDVVSERPSLSDTAEPDEAEEPVTVDAHNADDELAAVEEPMSAVDAIRGNEIAATHEPERTPDDPPEPPSLSAALRTNETRPLADASTDAEVEAEVTGGSEQEPRSSSTTVPERVDDDPPEPPSLAAALRGNQHSEPASDQDTAAEAAGSEDGTEGSTPAVTDRVAASADPEPGTRETDTTAAPEAAEPDVSQDQTAEPEVEVSGHDEGSSGSDSTGPDYGKTPAQIKYEQARAAANSLLDELRGELEDEGQI